MNKAHPYRPSSRMLPRQLLFLGALLVGCSEPPIPAAVTELSVLATTPEKIELSWRSNVNRVLIERRDPSGDFQPVTETSEGQYVDAGLKPETTYVYRIADVERKSSPVTSPAVTTLFRRPFPATTPEVPGRIQAEDFDQGAASVVYGLTSVRSSGRAPYRPTDASIRIAEDLNGGYALSGVRPGEWFDYSINVRQDGKYLISLRIASTINNGTLHLELGDQALTGPVTILYTGSPTQWIDVVIPAVQLKAGTAVLRVVFDDLVGTAGQYALNHLSFSPAIKPGEADPWDLSAKKTVTGPDEPTEIAITQAGAAGPARDLNWSVLPLRHGIRISRYGDHVEFSAFEAGQYLITATDPSAPTHQKSVVIEVNAQASASGGRWSEPVNWPTLAIHATLMPDGSVVTWGWHVTDPFGDTPTTWIDVWHPGTDQHRTGWQTSDNIFGGGHELTEDGKLFSAGGTLGQKPDNTWLGINSIDVFDAASGQWTASEKMQKARWYPTVTALSNGELLVTAGQDEYGIPVTLHEVWNASSGWRSLSSAVRPLPNYPFMHVAPDGRVFTSGPNPDMAFLDPSGTGRWSDAPKRDNIERSYGTSVLYDEGELIVVGGDDPATNQAVLVDLNANGMPSPTGSMAFKRRNFNATVLPDGQVLVTGGNLSGKEGGPVHAAEVWNPDTGRWRTLSSAQIPRPYHSTGLLMPDGRVFTAGGYDNALSRNAELFAPPYLLAKDGSGTLAAQPAIDSAPDLLHFDQDFKVSTADAAEILKVSLVKLGSTTHAFNMGQRYVKLAFNPVDGHNLRVRAPENANLAPPGYYLLYVINSKGVPSVGKIVHVN